jgi:hypothetical protein
MIFRSPSLAEMWLRRHDDANTLRAVRIAFQAIKITQVVSSTDQRLGAIYRELYERSIDFGGHPNERAVTGGMKVADTPEARHYQQIYLHGDGKPLLHAMKSTAQIGLCSLHIFQHVFKERFALLGTRDRLVELRKRIV